MIGRIDAGGSKCGAEFGFCPIAFADDRDRKQIRRRLAVSGLADRIVKASEDRFQIAPGGKGIAEIVFAQFLGGVVAELLGQRRQPGLGDLETGSLQLIRRSLADTCIGQTPDLVVDDPVVALL